MDKYCVRKKINAQTSIRMERYKYKRFQTFDEVQINIGLSRNVGKQVPKICRANTTQDRLRENQIVGGRMILKWTLTEYDIVELIGRKRESYSSNSFFLRKW
jgi:hypothetical protein